MAHEQHQHHEMAGGVDLSALKNGPKPEEVDRLVDEAVERCIVDAGLRCPCGELVRAGGVQIFAVRRVEASTPVGPRPSVQRAVVNFCGRGCPAFKPALAQVNDGAVLLLVRDTPDNDFLVEPGVDYLDEDPPTEEPPA
jgi:hypothetical protein